MGAEIPLYLPKSDLEIIFDKMSYDKKHLEDTSYLIIDDMVFLMMQELNEKLGVNNLYEIYTRYINKKL